jgi:hypothetical protein
MSSARKWGGGIDVAHQERALVVDLGRDDGAGE